MHTQPTLEELYVKYHTSPISGLSTEQVLLNQQAFGKNQIDSSPPKPIYMQILEAFKEPMVLLLVFAGVLALSINSYEYFANKEANFLECLGIFIAIFLSIGITLIMENKSQKAFEALHKMTEGNKIKTLRNGSISRVAQEDLVLGDIIFLESGDKIPSDCRIISAKELMSDESSLTGESMHVLKSEELGKQQISNTYENMLYSGCFITQGSAKAICVAIGLESEFGKVAKELNKSYKDSTPLQEKLKKLGTKITIFGAVAASLAFILQVVFFVLRGEIALELVSEAFISSVVLIVAAVPEGLPTIVAVSLALNVIKMSKQNALVKKLIACETIGCVNVICSDKTGTLTKNQMSVEHFFIHNKRVELKNKEEMEKELGLILENCALNSTADLEQKGDKILFLGNPTECALLVHAKNFGCDYRNLRENAEILQVFPFSSQAKNMITLAKMYKSIIAYTKGSPEKILDLCVDMDCSLLAQIKKEITYFQKQAYRVIAFAHRELKEIATNREEIEKEFVFDGFVAIADPLREDVYEAVLRAKEAGISLKILTGDNLETAKAIGAKLHLLEKGGVAIEASELEAMSEEEFSKSLQNIKIVARSTPSTKMRIVKELKKQGNVVALTGDGINDAPALKNADVGIAMGISGTEVSKEASDVVLLDDSFSTIIRAITWGRGIYQNFQRFIQFQLTVNLSSVIIVLFAVVMGFSAPFSALQLLWVNLIMDGPPALTLGLEPISKNLLKYKPTKRNANIITKSMLGLIVVSGIFISFVCLAQYFWNFLGASEEEKGSVLFTLFVVMVLFNAFNARELHNESIFKNLGANYWMVLTFVLTFILQVLIVQFGGEAFKTSPLELLMWGKIMVVGASVIVLGEIMRFCYRVVFKVN
ncbi:calcium-translocating P-type ATPase, PMCA-type [Helicobacter valdiviensis]|uniref:P-type Ca(2+) transporter n=1 Tax=Helicobacter valdiviensis TaxID=1458358 RepID=A0A2W6PN82_9HELI|nr:calcium-translocating P-type ATPase, PMCA-type [Helicobacter valdiviensis]PZT48163.1 calcium-translocating P-type ATPase, PMCA-type [Helicobacter valdiviensis]